MPVRLYVSGDSDGSQSTFFGIATFGADEDVLELLKDLPVDLAMSSKATSTADGKAFCAIRSVGGQEHGSRTVTRMVLMAAVKTIELLADGTEATLFTDNEFICSAVNRDWIQVWQRRGWHYANSGQEVRYVDLWKCLLEVKKKKRIMFRMVGEGELDSKLLDFVNRVIEGSLDE